MTTVRGANLSGNIFSNCSAKLILQFFKHAIFPPTEPRSGKAHVQLQNVADLISAASHLKTFLAIPVYKQIVLS